MNTTGKLFTGTLALVLIMTACIIPLYIADKWQEMEMQGEGAITYQDMLEQIGYYENNTLIPDPEPDYIPYLQQNYATTQLHRPSSSSTTQARLFTYYSTGNGYFTETISYMTWDHVGYDDYWDGSSFPSSTTRQISLWFMVHILPEDIFDDNANIIKVSWYSQQDAFKIEKINVIKSQANSVVCTYYTDWTWTSSNYYYEHTQFIVLSEEDINGIRAFYNSGNNAIFGFQVRLSWDDKDYFPASPDNVWSGGTLISSIEFLTSYYENITVISEQIITWDNTTTYNNHTIWSGADVTVSYMDIQKWILGAFGIGICVLALAVSPFWNPITDYVTISFKRRLRK